MTRTFSKAERKALDTRYEMAKAQLRILGQRKWRAEFLYPLMRRTAFQDFETLMQAGCEALADRVIEILGPDGANKVMQKIEQEQRSSKKR